MKFLAAVCFACLFYVAHAQNGYEIRVTLKPFRNQYIYLGHYYGKQLPIVDSVMLNDRSEGVFKGSKKLGGGIYLVGYPDRAHHFEILVDKDQHFSVIADTAAINKISFIHSPDNTDFKAYQDFMSEHGRQIEALLQARAQAKTKGDSALYASRADALNATIKKYRNQIIAEKPNSFMAFLLKAMREPELPRNEPAARKDTLFAYHYFKAHYWDGINFYDDRLVRTPFFEGRLDKYFETLVYPAADSVNKEIDWMLGYASINEEMQKFLLVKFVNRYLNQRYMWEDAVFVHLFEKYFAQNSYSWLTDKGKKIISDRAYNLMSNIMGNPAAEIELPDTAGKKTSLYSVEAPYVLLAIWDPTCSHCKEIVPRLDSMYHLRWKAMGLKLFGMAKETDGTRQDWLAFIRKNNLYDWVQVYDSKKDEESRISANVPGYAQLYDVQSFPTLYLLDKDKRIIAKKLSYDQVDEILKIKNNRK